MQNQDLVLFTLYGTEMYGKEIDDAIRMVSSGALSMPKGSLYVVLSDLESKGLIAARKGIDRSVRQRTYYSLTEKGKAEVEWVRLVQDLLIEFQKRDS